MPSPCAAQSLDAIVIGAGPAGSACAYHLARAGRRVLLFERQRFPRDKSCGDGLTPNCLRLLDEMGVLDKLDGDYRVGSVRVVHRGPPLRHRDFSYAGVPGSFGYGMVVPRFRLDQLICAAAVGAGAMLVEGARVAALVVEEGRAAGVSVDCGDGPVRVDARIIVAADGAQSRFAAQMGLSAGAAELGFAIRGYCDNLVDLDPTQEIHLPLTDPSGDYVLPSYGWIFPTGPASANVGVGIMSRVLFDDVRSLYARFFVMLRECDSRFAAASAAGPLLGAPLRFDFAPGRCAAPGLLLVGDAAGLTSPFTGEGISYGLESGRLAAQTIDRCLRLSPESPPIEEDYGTLMGHHFAGYFELGRRSARRHMLIWKVLDTSFDSERPVFGLLRRAAMLPEGAGPVGLDGALLDDLGPILPRGDPLFRRQLIDIGVKLVDSVRQDWPFVGRLDLARRSARSVVFRPSLLMLLAARFGDADAPGLRDLGVALDLAYLGILAQSGVEEEGNAGAPARENWSNKFALLLGDFLFARAIKQASSGEFEHGDAIIAALERSCRGYLAQLATAGRIDTDLDLARAQLTDRIAPLFELPFALGAAAAAAPATAAPSLTAFGRALGLIFAVGEEQLGLEDRPSQAASQAMSVLATDLSRHIAGLPLLHAAGAGAADAVAAALRADPPDRPTLARLVREAGTRDAMAREAHTHASAARAALAALPDLPVCAALEKLVRLGLTRAFEPPPPDAHTA